MKKINAKVLMILAAVATVFESLVSTSACFWFTYQPEEPECLRD